VGRVGSGVGSMAGPRAGSSAFGIRAKALVAGALLATVPFVAGQTKASKPVSRSASTAAVERGKTLFSQNCSFCHGREGFGGETGPNLMDSDVVGGDVGGNKIGPMVRNGRPENGMPAFKLPAAQIAELAAFLHAQKAKSDSRPGGRRGVSAADLQTGNIEAGKQYFNGAGTCSSCHSPTGDLAGVARRYRGLELEKRMLYPKNPSATVTVTLPSGQTVSGKLAYQDEFTLGLTDAAGWYQSWPASSIKYTINAPAEAHADLLPKYSDDDVHNLMAYLQTLR
jgi:cytochrome c oxidase cbb3-type subunit III